MTSLCLSFRLALLESLSQILEILSGSHNIIVKFTYIPNPRCVAAANRGRREYGRRAVTWIYRSNFRLTRRPPPEIVAVVPPRSPPTGCVPAKPSSVSPDRQRLNSLAATLEKITLKRPFCSRSATADRYNECTACEWSGHSAGGGIGDMRIQYLNYEGDKRSR